MGILDKLKSTAGGKFCRAVRGEPAGNHMIPRLRRRRGAVPMTKKHLLAASAFFHGRRRAGSGGGACPGRYTRPYFVLMRSSFSSMGSAPSHRKMAVAAPWTRSIGRPVM